MGYMAAYVCILHRFVLLHTLCLNVFVAIWCLEKLSNCGCPHSYLVSCKGVLLNKE